MEGKHQFAREGQLGSPALGATAAMLSTIETVQNAGPSQRMFLTAARHLACPTCQAAPE